MNMEFCGYGYHDKIECPSFFISMIQYLPQKIELYSDFWQHHTEIQSTEVTSCTDL